MARGKTKNSDASMNPVDPKIRLLRLGLFAGGTLLLLAVAATATWYSLRPKEPTIPWVAAQELWIDTVRQGEFRREVHASGVLVPKEQRWVAADVVGVVERIRAQPGQTVKPDTVIMELRNVEIGEQLLAARAALSAAQADHAAKELALQSEVLDREGALATAVNEAKTAQLKFEAETTLAKSGIVSKLQQAQSRLQSDLLNERVRLEQKRLSTLKDNVAAQLRADTARLEQLHQAATLRQHQADGLLVRANMSGVLQTIEVTEGKQVHAGEPLALLAKPESLQARLNVQQGQAREIALGLPVVVDLLDTHVDGHVTRVAPTVQDGKVEVLVDLGGPLPQGTRPELSVEGAIELERSGSILTLSRPTTLRKPSNLALYRIESDGSSARRIDVKFGRLSGDHAEVLDGLAQGDRVVLSDLSRLGEPARIRLR
jgi:HlyD family secretion protein